MANVSWDNLTPVNKQNASATKANWNNLTPVSKPANPYADLGATPVNNPNNSAVSQNTALNLGVPRETQSDPGFLRSLGNAFVNTAVIDPVNTLGEYIGRPILSAVGVKEPKATIPDLPTRGVGEVLGDIGGFVVPLKEADLAVTGATKLAPKALKLAEKIPDVRTYTEGIPALGAVAHAAGDAFFPEATRSALNVGKKVVGAAKTAGREAAVGATAGFLGSPVGQKEGGAKVGAAIGAVSPVVAKVLALAAKPVATKAMVHLENPLIKKVLSSVTPDTLNPDSDKSFLQQGAQNIKAAHDASKKNYDHIYANAGFLGDEAHADLAQKTKDGKAVPFQNNSIFPLNFLQKANQDIVDPIKHEYGLTDDEVDKYLKPLAKPLYYKSTKKLLQPTSFSDLVNLRRRALSLPNRGGTDDALRNAINKAKSDFIDLLDSHGQMVANKSEPFQDAWDEYKEANKAFAKHAQTYRMQPTAAKGDLQEPSNRFYDALKFKNTIPSENFISKNFQITPTDKSNAVLNKLTDMLGGDKEQAKELIKTAMFDQQNPSSFISKYRKLSPKQQNALFSNAEQEMMKAAQKAQEERTTQGRFNFTPEMFGHYGTAGGMGYALGHLMGNPFVGMLLGLGAKGGADLTGYALAKRAASTANLEKIQRLLDSKLLSPKQEAAAKHLLQSATIQGGTAFTPRNVKNASMIGFAPIVKNYQYPASQVSLPALTLGNNKS